MSVRTKFFLIVTLVLAAIAIGQAGRGYFTKESGIANRDTVVAVLRRNL